MIKRVNALERVVDSSNLAVDPIDSELLRPVATPERITQSHSHVLGRVNHERGWTLLLTDNLALWALDEGESAARSLGLLDGTPTCVVEGQGEVVVMTTVGATRLRRDEVYHRWESLGAMPHLPEVSLLAVSGTSVSSRVTSVTLTGNYRYGGELNVADRAALTEALLTAYGDMHRTAASQGLALQPVVACYRVIDDEGATLYQSEPIMVGLEGFQCASGIEMEVERDTGITRGVEITARGWRLGVMVHDQLDGAWARKAARLEVLASPPLLPVDFKGEASASLNAASDRLYCSMPGIAGGTMGSRQMECMIRRVLERHEMMTIVGTIPYPFGGGALQPGIIREIALPLTADARGEWVSLTSALNREPRRANPISLPMTFTADVASRCGDTILYGNPKIFPRTPMSALSMAQSVGQGGWHAAVIVTLRGGEEKIVWSGQGRTGEPLTMSPLLCYPSAEAEKMEIRLQRGDGTCYREVLALVPLPGSDRSYFLHDTLRPWAVTTEAEGYVVPASTATAVERRGAVIATLAGRPTEPTGIANVSNTRLLRLTPASRSSSAWNFGRAHFYGFSTQGVFSIAVANGGVLNGADLIDNRGVDSPAKVALGCREVWALAGEQLVKVSGNRCVDALAHTRAESLAYCQNGRGEVWLRDSDDGVKAYDPVTGLVSRRHDATWIWSDGSLAIYHTSRGIFRAGNDFYTSTASVSRISIEGEARLRGALEALVAIPITGADVDLTVEISVSDYPWRPDTPLDDHARRVKRMNVKGRMRHELEVPMICPAREYVNVKIEGTVSGDTVIRR